uniref:Uncharacterized protein n=1 Tax=Anopheles maculatus TaxID=74869 RepID=A0A182T479_9DIPT
MRKSPNSLSPIAILPNTPPPARIFAQPETPTTPLTDGTVSPTSTATDPPSGAPVVVELPTPLARPSSIRSASGSGPQLRFSSLLDPGDITPITSPLPSVTSGMADGSIYTIFGADSGIAPNDRSNRRHSSLFLSNSVSNGSATSATPASAGGLLPSATNGSAVNCSSISTSLGQPNPVATSVSASNANSASAKSRSRRSSELSQQNSMKSHASVGSSSRKRSSQAHIELNGPPMRDRPRCLKSSFLRRKCKEYAGKW